MFLNTGTASAPIAVILFLLLLLLLLLLCMIVARSDFKRVWRPVILQVKCPSHPRDYNLQSYAIAVRLHKVHSLQRPRQFLLYPVSYAVIASRNKQSMHSSKRNQFWCVPASAGLCISAIFYTMTLSNNNLVETLNRQKLAYFR